MFARSCLLLTLTAALAGCSAVIDADTDVFGSSDVTLPDSGPPDGADAGPGVDGGPGPADMLVRPDMPPADCPGPAECSAGDSLVCQDGERVRVPCPAGCNGATGECLPEATGFTPSNVGREQFRDDGPALDLAEVFRYDTNTCTSMTGAARVVTMRDGGEACVLSVSSFRLRSDGYMQVGGGRPLIIVASDEIRIEGVIDVSARGDQSGPAGFAGGRVVADAEDGQGEGGGAGGENDGFSDGGGGGGGGCGGGGDGGEGGSAAGGEGGSPFLDGSDLQPLFGGSGGGRGRGAIRTGFSNAGEGGAGGGALQLTAANRLIIAGGVVAGGGGGQPGRAFGDGGTNWGSGGGGGAGGNVILEAPDIDVEGGLSVVGGGGGGSASGSAGEAGEDGFEGATGRPAGGAGAGPQYGADGGDGAGLATVAGAGGDTNSNGGANGGGGGGASGCVVIRSSGSPAVPVNPPAAVSNLSLLP